MAKAKAAKGGKAQKKVETAALKAAQKKVSARL
jgi:hypothetical protein